MEIDLEGFSNILDIGEKITLTQTIQNKLSEIEYSPLLNTYIATKIKELQGMQESIGDLLYKDVIQSPTRISKVKKSRIVFDKSMDLKIIQNNVEKLETKLQEEWRTHIQLYEKLMELNILIQKQSSNELEQLDTQRLAQIYGSEVNLLQEYFNNIENHPNNINDTSIINLQAIFNEIIEDEQMLIIVKYFANYTQLIDDLQLLKKKLIQIQDHRDDQSTENSRNGSMMDQKLISRSKSHTYELNDQYRDKVLKEITNEIKEASKETCINCIIF